MSLALAIAEFILHLFTGKVWAAWRAHKESEAQNEVNKVNSLPDAAVSAELRSDWTKRS